MTTQNLWDAAKAVLRGKLRASTFLPQATRKKHQIDSLSLHLKQLEKEEFKNPKN